MWQSIKSLDKISVFTSLPHEEALKKPIDKSFSRKGSKVWDERVYGKSDLGRIIHIL